MSATDELRSLAAPIVAGAGLELWDVEVERGVVRILVDRPSNAESLAGNEPGRAGPEGHQQGPAGPEGHQQGVDLDALSAVSRSLSIALDEHADIAPSGRYQLEVSSPGLERTLRTPAHYRRYVGTELAVKLRAPLSGIRRLRGVLIDAGDSAIRLATDAVGDGDPGRHLEVPYSLIERARTVLQWGPSPKPRTSKRGKRPGRSRASAAGRPDTSGTPLTPTSKDA